MSLWSLEEPVIKMSKKQPNSHQDGAKQRNKGLAELILAKKLARRNSDVRAVEDSNPKVYSGRIFGSLATYRAGRTTLARVLTTFAKPTSRGGGRAVEIMADHFEPPERRTSEDGM